MIVAALCAVLLGAGNSGALAEAGRQEAGSALTVAQAPVTGPISAPAPEAADEINDPIEPINRFIFGVNQVFLDYLLGPISEAYEKILPDELRRMIHNFLHHLNSPVVLANDILQGERERALETLGRIVVNTTVGIGGLIDIAAEMGVKRHKEDFGQTLGVWGVGEGFYVVLPLFGPSNPRDAVGELLVDNYFDPLGLWISNTDRDDLVWARRGVKAVDEYSGVREDLAQIRKTSIDYYATIRSLYRQKRKAEISNGRDLQLPPIPDLSYAPESPGIPGNDAFRR